jgi:3',5'-cyclic AMP phosphodiesterase CpdA
MEVAWLTDPHLNFAGVRAAEQLALEVAARGAKALLISGDIGEAHDLEGWLTVMASMAGAPVYFVLGNHDFYGSSVAAVRADVRELCQGYGGDLVYLTGGEPVALSARTGLVGHDGWGDARAGDFARSPVMLADFMQIEDLRGLTRDELAAALMALGDQAAAELEPALAEAMGRFEHVIVLTHVPPFVQACWHEGKLSDANWSPFFVCEAVGEVIRRQARRAPGVRVTVLCGHTHGAGEAWVEPNVHVKTGAARYRKPALQATLWLR